MLCVSLQIMFSFPFPTSSHTISAPTSPTPGNAVVDTAVTRHSLWICVSPRRDETRLGPPGCLWSPVPLRTAISFSATGWGSETCCPGGWGMPAQLLGTSDHTAGPSLVSWAWEQLPGAWPTGAAETRLAPLTHTLSEQGASPRAGPT